MSSGVSVGRVRPAQSSFDIAKESLTASKREIASKIERGNLRAKALVTPSRERRSRV
jgi:hypothetical protein